MQLTSESLSTADLDPYVGGHVNLISMRPGRKATGIWIRAIVTSAEIARNDADERCLRLTTQGPRVLKRGGEWMTIAPRSFVIPLNEQNTVEEADESTLCVDIPQTMTCLLTKSRTNDITEFSMMYEVNCDDECAEVYLMSMTTQPADGVSILRCDLVNVIYC